MKIFLNALMGLGMGMALLSDGNASVDVVPLEEMSFAAYQVSRGDEPLSVVVGCGRSHNPLTVVGMPHEHEDAYTLDWGAAEGARHGVWNPHKAGNILSPETWADIPDGCLSFIRLEHVPLFGDLNPAVVGKIWRELEEVQTVGGRILTPEEHAAFLAQAKKTASDQAFNFCVEQSQRCLKSGGILEIYPQINRESSSTLSPFNALEALTEFDSVFPRDPLTKEGELRSTLFVRLPFDKGFSQIKLTFYALLRSREGLVPCLATEFTLDFTRTLFDAHLEKNDQVIKELLALWYESLTFVQVTLTKA